MPNGKAEALALMNETEYTSVALMRLGVQVAMRDPK